MIGLLLVSLGVAAAGGSDSSPAAPRADQAVHTRVQSACGFAPTDETLQRQRALLQAAGQPERPLHIHVRSSDIDTAARIEELFRGAALEVLGGAAAPAGSGDGARPSPIEITLAHPIKRELSTIGTELAEAEADRPDVPEGARLSRAAQAALDEADRKIGALQEEQAALFARLAPQGDVGILQIDISRSDGGDTLDLTVRHMVRGQIGEFGHTLRTIDAGSGETRLDENRGALIEKLRHMLGQVQAPEARISALRDARGTQRIPRKDPPLVSTRAGTVTLTAEGRSDRGGELQYCWLIDPVATREAPVAAAWTGPSVEPTLSIMLPNGALPSRPTRWQLRVVAWDGVELSAASEAIDLEVVPNYLNMHEGIGVAVARRPALMPLAKQGRSPAHLMVFQAEVAPWAPELRYTWDLPATVACRSIVGTDTNQCTTTAAGTLVATPVPFLALEHADDDTLSAAVFAQPASPGATLRSDPVELRRIRQHSYASTPFPWEVTSQFELRGFTERQAGDPKRRMVTAPAVTLGIGAAGFALESGLFTTYRPAEGEARYVGWHAGVSTLLRTAITSFADTAYGYERQRMVPLDDGLLVDVYGRISYWNHPPPRDISGGDHRLRQSLQIELGPRVRVGRWMGTATVFGLRSYDSSRPPSETLKNPLGASLAIGWHSVGAASPPRPEERSSAHSTTRRTGPLRPCQSRGAALVCAEQRLIPGTSEPRARQLRTDGEGGGAAQDAQPRAPLYRSARHGGDDWHRTVELTIPARSLPRPSGQQGHTPESLAAMEQRLAQATHMQLQRWIADHIVHARQTRGEVHLARLLQGSWRPGAPAPDATRTLSLHSEHHGITGSIQTSVACASRTVRYCTTTVALRFALDHPSDLKGLSERELTRSLLPYMVSAWTGLRRPPPG